MPTKVFRGEYWLADLDRWMEAMQHADPDYEIREILTAYRKEEDPPMVTIGYWTRLPEAERPP